MSKYLSSLCIDDTDRPAILHLGWIYFNVEETRTTGVRIIGYWSKLLGRSKGSWRDDIGGGMVKHSKGKEEKIEREKREGEKEGEGKIGRETTA